MNDIKLPIRGMDSPEEVIINTDPIVEGKPVDDKVIDEIDDEVIEIDGQDYQLDKDGNAVKDGAIFKTKAEIEALSVVNDDDVDEDGIDLNSIVKELNLDFVNDEGKPLEFEPTKEGLVSFVQAAYESGSKAASMSAREHMIKSYPELENVINYIAVNGSLEGYETSKVDYNSLTLDKNNQNQLIAIVRKSREAKGDTEAEINKFVSAIVADNSLYEIAESSLNHLKNVVSKHDTDLAAQAEAMERERIDAYNNYINSIKTSINNGVVKLGDKEVRLPVQFKVTTDDGKVETRTKEQFLDYILREREFSFKDGRKVRATQYEVDKYIEENRLGYNKDIYDAMRLFTGGDLTSVIDKSVESRRVSDIKQKLRLKSGESATTRTTGKSDFQFPVKQQIIKPIN